MPWLVVTGTGSWGTTLGRVWEEPTTELATGRWKYDARTYTAGKHYVEQAVRDKAEEEGYPSCVFFFEDSDEPELLPPDDTGVLKPEDVRTGMRTGVHLAGVEADEPEPEVVVDPEGMPLDYPCPQSGCERAFPSEGSRDRHVEFDHQRRHEVLQRREGRNRQFAKEEKAELQRVADHEGKLPPWEREAVDPSA